MGTEQLGSRTASIRIDREGVLLQSGLGIGLAVPQPHNAKPFLAKRLVLKDYRDLIL